MRFRRKSKHDTLRNGIYTCAKHNLLYSTFEGLVFHKINKHIECDHKWRYDEWQTKAFCKKCGQGSSSEFWAKVDSGEIEDRWRK